MPRYYFTVHDGTSFEDENGTELPDLDAARREATRYGGALLADDKGAIWKRRGWHMDVTDQSGLVLLRLDIAANTSPASVR